MNPETVSSTAITLSAFDLACASLLVLMAGIISIVLKLGLERRLLIASLRTVIQLLLVGYILRFVFNLDSPFPLLIVLAVMIGVAAYTAVGRSTRFYRGATLDTLLTLLITGLLTTFFVTGIVIKVSPWYLPRYVIPVAGMVIGNAMTGVSLTLDHLLTDLKDKKSEVELELSLGATSWEAARRILRAAIRRGMIPIVNSMMVVGIVTLPGMMTGQILAGADPIEAVKYQIVVMFMIATSSALGCMLTSLLVYRKIFNRSHQLRLDRII